MLIICTDCYWNIRNSSFKQRKHLKGWCYLTEHQLHEVTNLSFLFVLILVVHIHNDGSDLADVEIPL